jgi:hypothetical protein
MASIPETTPARALRSRPAATGWRGRLVVAVAFGAAVGLIVGDPSARLAADPELAQLLRGMALIKALLIAVGLRVLWWRFGLAIEPVRARAYVACLAFMAFAAGLAWQLSYLPILTLAFHGALLSLGVLAWRDGGVATPGRR